MSKPRWKVTVKDRNTGQKIVFDVDEQNFNYETKNLAYYNLEAAMNGDNPIVRADLKIVQPKVSIKNGKRN